MLSQAQIKQLERSPDVGRQCLAEALRKASAHQLSAPELAWFERIETIRDGLNASTEEIVREVHGAGSVYGANVASSSIVVGDLARSVSKSQDSASVLFHMIRATAPAVCIEMGTALGVSGAYQAAALALNGSGHLTTIEGDPHVAAKAQETFDQLGLDNVTIRTGRFQDVLPGILHEVAPIDYVFVDGHHDGIATITYFDQILPYLSPRSVIIFDDINWSKSMSLAWNLIVSHPRVGTSVDLRDIGICLVGECEGEQVALTDRSIKDDIRRRGAQLVPATLRERAKQIIN